MDALTTTLLAENVYVYLHHVVQWAHHHRCNTKTWPHDIQWPLVCRCHRR